MSIEIERIKKTRQYLIDELQGISVDRMNKIPNNFNNNIIWNLGHLIVSQQGICYIRAGLTPRLGERLIAQFKQGTKPEAIVEISEIELIKELLISTLA